MKFIIPQIFRKDITNAIKILKSLGCTEIYLFGSIVKGDYRKNSDIDIAIKDCPPDKFYYAIGKLLLSLDHSIDLVDINHEKKLFKLLKEDKELVRVA